MCRSVFVNSRFLNIRVTDLMEDRWRFLGQTPWHCGTEAQLNKKPVQTILVAELSAYFPWSRHQPKPRVPLFADAKNVVGFVDGHISYLKIYWNSNTPSDFALQYNPPAAYDYKWSDD